jgi:hypothetical protein
MTETLLDRFLARWREGWHAAAELEELQSLDPDEAARIASELNLTVAELESVAANGAGSQRLMERMMEAFHLNQQALAQQVPASLRLAEVTCSRCGAKKRCSRELASGTAAENAYLFCPNADFFRSFGNA